jgi:hypothetical protein
VQLDITPEPTPEERAALELVVEHALGEESDGGPGAWWRAGVLEAVEGEDSGL